MRMIFQILHATLIWLAVPLFMGACLRVSWEMFMLGWGWL